MSETKEVLAFNEVDGYLFGNGTNYESYKKLGAHPTARDGVDGVYFAVWAPSAKAVSVLTNANEWSETDGAMTKDTFGVGVWELFVPKAQAGDIYRFVVVGCDDVKRYKSDPYAFYAEKRPNNASRVAALDTYTWKDADYMAKQSNKDVATKPLSIYEVHLGSWKKDYSKDYDDGFLNYREYADQLASYVKFMGYTHVELIGICEHPFDGSWGYQCTGFFAPTSRYGAPDDFRYFVDKMHAEGIGVILDWVPAHFPKDSFCMENFDGTHLYEYSDPLRMDMPGWGTYAFDHGKNQVRSFLISSAMYWIKEFHMDALRVDAAAAMLLNNFDRAEYRPNLYGGVENLEGIGFLRQLNDTVHTTTNAFVIAEDSSITAKVTESPKEGGIGFDFKWDLGWMNETLKYFEKDPIYRKYHHSLLTHPYDYAFTENFVLVLSHDEVVHLKKSMLGKMPGGLMDQLAGLKTLYTIQYTSPGKKLLFMGQEFGEDREWDEKREINWWFADDFGHRDVLQCVKNLNEVYKKYPVLYQDSKNGTCFEWINGADCDRNIVSYIRRNPWNYNEAVLVVANLSPVSVPGYCCGVPAKGLYSRVFSTYDSLPGQGSPAELGSVPTMAASKEECDGRAYRLYYDLRPFEAIIVTFPTDVVETMAADAAEAAALAAAAAAAVEAPAAAAVEVPEAAPAEVPAAEEAPKPKRTRKTKAEKEAEAAAAAEEAPKPKRTRKTKAEKEAEAAAAAEEAPKPKRTRKTKAEKEAEAAAAAAEEAPKPKRTRKTKAEKEAEAAEEAPKPKRAPRKKKTEE